MTGAFRSFNDFDQATREVVDLLVDASFCSLKVYECVLQIEFMQTDQDGCLCSVWLRVNCGFEIDEFRADDHVDDPFAARANAVGALSSLLGETVSDAHVETSGALTIRSGQRCLRVYSDGEDFETVWSVNTGSSEPYGFHERYVGLVDTGDVIVARSIPDPAPPTTAPPSYP